MKKWSQPKVEKLDVSATQGGYNPNAIPDDVTHYNWGYTVEYGS